MANPLAFVTGASSGIGYNLAKVLAERGYDLFITAESDRLDKAEADFRALGTNVFAIKADARKREEVDRVWAAIQATGRPVDVACINAGIGEGGLFATESSLDQELDIVQLNCASTVHFAKHIARQMVERKDGKILFTASVASEMTAPREAVYAASKAFVLGLSKALHFELKDEGVTVTALQPGPTDTDFFNRAHLGNTQAGTEGKKQSEPYDVAVDGIDALFAGKENVYAHAATLKLEGTLMGLIPDSLQAAMHNKQAKPLENEQS
jgi:short-subunit dehydrogenase